MENHFESQPFPNSILALSKICGVERDRFGQEAYILRFSKEACSTTVRIALNDEQSGADLIIINMTTLPESEQHKGYGGTAVQSIVEWAIENSLKNIQAVQVQSDSEQFWISNGFESMHNETNDFKYKSA